MVLTPESACSFPAELQSVRAARLFVQDGVGVDADHPISLCVSELATNAVMHAGTEFRVVVLSTDRKVRVEVHDEAAGDPEVRTADEYTVGGRGLMIVEHLADRWGVDERDDGTKSVWFELSLAS
jgi:anti-sigma regulatory factor (Ser/Thr protein kinase)